MRRSRRRRSHTDREEFKLQLQVMMKAAEFSCSLFVCLFISINKLFLLPAVELLDIVVIEEGNVRMFLSNVRSLWNKLDETFVCGLILDSAL